MFNNLRGVLGFSKREMNGVLICIPLMIFFIFLPSFYTKYFSPDYDNSTDQLILDSLVNLFVEHNQKKDRPITHFFFDPNEVSADSLELLGLPIFLADRIDNYRLAGGSFRKEDDLKKIYGFPDSLYDQLAPYVIFRKSAPVAVSKVSRSDKEDAVVVEKENREEMPIEVLLVNLNVADTTDLKRLYGIGSVYARRIIKYRALLGGFVSKEQLKEVYGISDTLFLSISNQLTIVDSTLQKISINVATFKEINAHPYISYEQTKEIFNAKSRIGKYKTAADLLNLKSFDSTQVLRALPYIDFR